MDTHGNTLELILKYGLAIRQIPEVLHHAHSMEWHKEGNVIKEIIVNPYKTYEKSKELLNNVHGDYRFEDDTKTVYRRHTTYTTIPNDAGQWMVQKSPSTLSSTMTWSYKDKNCYRATTLEEAVLQCVTDIEKHNRQSD